MKNTFLKFYKNIFLFTLLLTACCGNINNQEKNETADKSAIANTILSENSSEALNKSEADKIMAENVSNLKSNIMLSDSGTVMLALTDTLKCAGFLSVGSGEKIIFKKEGITLVLNTVESSVKKGIFTYYLNGVSMESDGFLYVEKDLIEKMINQRIIINNTDIFFEEYQFKPHAWTDASNSLVAHACGGINGHNGNNCLEALVKNYNNGHTVFEIDLRFTSDEQIVAVHDWHGYGGIKTRDEFKKIKIADVFTSMDIDDILKIMLLNKEIYIITDTKSFESGDTDETKKQFELLRDKALSYDEELLKRIVPQIYNQEMYWLIAKIYPFESIIYTLYESPDTDSQVVEFVKDKENIKVITMGPVRFSETFYNELTTNDKLIYLFTLNDLDEIKEYLNKGVRGIYTDFIFPRDL